VSASFRGFVFLDFLAFVVFCRVLLIASIRRAGQEGISLHALRPSQPRFFTVFFPFWLFLSGRGGGKGIIGIMIALAVGAGNTGENGLGSCFYFFILFSFPSFLRTVTD